MHDALRATDRDIVYSISNSAPYADAPLWVEYTDCWRTTGDIRDTWKSISSIGFEQQRWAPFCGPGHWPDADMLVVGLVGWGPKLPIRSSRPTNSIRTCRSGPCSLRRCSSAAIWRGSIAFTKSLLTNDEVIAVNQDPLGVHAVAIWEKGGTGDLHQAPRRRCDGRKGCSTKPSNPAKIGFTLKQLGIRGYAGRARPVEAERPHDHRQGLRDTSPAHGVVLVKIAPGNPTRNDLKK